MKLYALTSVRDKEALNRSGKPYMSNSARCVGIYTELEFAKEAVLKNYGDIYEEGYYPLAVIEALESDSVYGLPKDGIEQYWFEWSNKLDLSIWSDSAMRYSLPRYQPIETPERFKHIIMFWS